MIESSFTEVQRAVISEVNNSNGNIHHPLFLSFENKSFLVTVHVNERKKQPSFDFKIHCSFFTKHSHAHRELNDGLKNRYFQSYVCKSFAPPRRRSISEVREQFEHL